MRIRAGVGALLLTVLPTVAAINDTITVTVNAGERHQFGGLGATLTNGTPGGWGSMSAADRKTFLQNMFRESRFRNLMLWGNLWFTPNDTSSADTSRITILQTQLDILTWAQEAGVDHIMVNPINDRPLNSHISFWTQCATMLRNRNINVNVMCFINKPNTGQNAVDSGKRRRSPTQVVEGIKALRQALDTHGMQDVRIGGPSIIEWHPRTWLTYGDLYDFKDGDTATYYDTLLADQTALDAVDAFDWQSYGASMGTWADSLARAHGKEVWVSLAATDAPYEWDTNHLRGKNYVVNGPVIAANCIGNLNHGVSRWNYWLLADLVRTASATTPTYNGRYYYLANISQGFDKGAIFRRCTSNHSRLPTPDMRWNYNRQSPTVTLQTQPDILAAAARNPDSTWVIGVQNVSNLLSQHKACNDSGVARTYRVNVDIQELRDIDSLQFTAKKCVDVTGIKDGGTYLMRNGMLSFSINALEEYVLRSEKAVSRVQPRSFARALPGCRIRETAQRGVFVLDLGGAAATTAHVRIVGMNGRTVVIADAVPGKPPVFDLRRASPGTYVAEVTTGTKTVRAQIVVR